MTEIESFAELGEFFDRPVKLYSSGMMVRLGFSMFACFEPEVFIVDEALSVGDVFFQQKCVRRIEQMLAAGTTMLFVSHDMHLVRRLCNRAILLSHGRVEFEGAPEECVARYYSRVGNESKETTGPIDGPALRTSFPRGRDDLLAHDILRGARSRHGAGGLRMRAATFQNESGAHTLSLRQMETATIRILLAASEPFPRPSAGLHLFDRLGNLVFAAGTQHVGATLPPLGAQEEQLVTLRLKFSVQPGEYTLSLGCSAVPPSGPDVGVLEDQCEGLGPIAVHPMSDGTPPFHGIAQLPMEVEL